MLNATARPVARVIPLGGEVARFLLIDAITIPPPSKYPWKGIVLAAVSFLLGFILGAYF